MDLGVGESIIIDLAKTETAGLENRYVRSVIEWTPLVPANYTVTNNAVLSLVDERRTSVKVQASVATTITALEVHGRGVALYGDLTIPEVSDAAAIVQYRRRTLDLPTSFVGDGLNDGGNGLAEGRAQAKLLLNRYARPQLSGRIPFDGFDHIEALLDLQISDPVLLQLGVGLPVGGYRVEGNGCYLRGGHRHTEGWLSCLLAQPADDNAERRC